MTIMKPVAPWQSMSSGGLGGVDEAQVGWWTLLEGAGHIIPKSLKEKGKLVFT